MNKKIKITIVLAVLLPIVILLLGFLVARRESQSTVRNKALPTPNIPRGIEGAPQTTLQVEQGDFDFPSSVQLLRVQRRAINLEEAKKIASNLGFSGEPSEFNGLIEGLKYLWSNEEKYLTITPGLSNVSYGLNIPHPPETTRTRLSVNNLEEIALGFISEKLGVPRASLKVTAVQALAEDERTEGFTQVDEGDAKVFQVNLNYREAAWEILTLTPSEPIVYVRLLPNGEILNIEAVVVENATLTEERYEILSYEDLASSLNKAVLIALLNDRVSIGDLKKEDITNATINKISLVYLWDNSNSQNLQPVFLLEGPARVRASSANYAQFYLPALKTNTP